MPVTVDRVQSPIGPIVRASVSHAGGVLTAHKYPNKPLRVTFVDQWGEVSYPMMTGANKRAWAALVQALA